ncbi:hypothetical protein KK062_30210, partial [Fulvivirgaceae bacterium PWU5]
QKEGDITSVQRFGTTDQVVTAYPMWQESDAVIKRIAFLRLKTLTIAYSLPRTVLDPIHVDNGKVFLQAQNLYTESILDLWDPETLSVASPPRIVSLGFQIKL